jgi:hypothetical protein
MHASGRLRRTGLQGCRQQAETAPPCSTAAMAPLVVVFAALATCSGSSEPVMHIADGGGGVTACCTKHIRQRRTDCTGTALTSKAWLLCLLHDEDSYRCRADTCAGIH